MTEAFRVTCAIFHNDVNRGVGLNGITGQCGVFVNGTVDGAAEVIVSGRNGEDFDIVD